MTAHTPATMGRMDARLPAEFGDLRAALEDITHPPEWWQHAACRGMGFDLFFDPTREQQALAICRSGCTVLDQCLDGALDSGDRDGVRGGLTGEQRRKLLRRARRAAS